MRSASANVLPDPAEAFIISKAGVKKKILVTSKNTRLLINFMT